jgi:hypothetical protein
VDPDPEPEPEPGEVEGFDFLPKALSAGLHFTAGPPGKMAPDAGPLDLPDTCRRYISEGKPSIVKGVSGGDVYRVGRFARAVSPGTRAVWRRVVSDGEFITGDLGAQAQRYLDQYKTEASAASRNLAVSEAEFWDKIDYIGGLNELISNWGALTDTQVEFECELGEKVKAQLGHVRLMAPAVPVGNPSHEMGDILRLAPLAALSQRDGHVLDYHAYWTSGKEPGRSYLDQEWQWHAGRWTEWDKAFNERGIYPLYCFGESGIVFDPTGGAWVGSGGAWKEAGSILYFRDQIARFNERIREWNAAHNNRCLGGVLFTCEYSWGWDRFLLSTGDLLEILAWMKSL